MKESNAGSLMELLTNTMDWVKADLALARVMGMSSNSAIMVEDDAQKACDKAGICCQCQSAALGASLAAALEQRNGAWGLVGACSMVTGSGRGAGAGGASGI